MLRDRLLRAVRALLPVSVPDTVQGTRPGFVWEPARQRWVDESETWKPGRAFYTLVGPVYAPTHGHP